MGSTKINNLSFETILLDSDNNKKKKMLWINNIHITFEQHFALMI